MTAIWTTPKEDWDTNYGINDVDFNRIETNTQYLFEQDGNNANHLRNYISGFTVNANSGSEGVYEIRVSGGIWSNSADNFVDWGSKVIVKTLSASNWTAGGAGQAKLDDATFSTNAWFWVFALYNPTTSAHDFALDDDITGANLGPATAAGYTLSRRICAVLTNTDIAVNGIMPMDYNSNERTINYAGDATARAIFENVVAGVPETLTLTLGGGTNIIPIDGATNNGGVLEIDVATSVDTVVTIWSPDIFGTAFYSGVGSGKFISSTVGYTQTFKIPCPSGDIRINSTASATLGFTPVSMTYNTDDLT
jgi:hypothetical protein